MYNNVKIKSWTKTLIMWSILLTTVVGKVGRNRSVLCTELSPKAFFCNTFVCLLSNSKRFVLFFGVAFSYIPSPSGPFLAFEFFQ